MELPSLTTALPTERSKAIALIMLGFASDSLVRWLWPAAEQYLSAAPVIDAFGGNAVDAGTRDQR